MTDIKIQVPETILHQLWSTEEKGDDVRHVITIAKPEGYKNYILKLETFDGEEVVGGEDYYSAEVVIKERVEV